MKYIFSGIVICVIILSCKGGIGHCSDCMPLSVKGRVVDTVAKMPIADLKVQLKIKYIFNSYDRSSTITAFKTDRDGSFDITYYLDTTMMASNSFIYLDISDKKYALSHTGYKAMSFKYDSSIFTNLTLSAYPK